MQESDRFCIRYLTKFSVDFDHVQDAVGIC